MATPPLTNQVYKDFYKYMKTFLKELIAAFPHIGEIKIILASCTISKKLNKKLPHKLFNKYIAAHYEKQIVERDEDYFLSDEFKFSFWETIEKVIKRELKSLDDVNKRVIWDHLQCLIVLNRKCLDYRRRKEEDDSGDEHVQITNIT